jgi:PhnB protein
MAMAVKAIPEGFHSITPYLYVRGAAKALEFYAKAFGAKELFRMPGPDGRIAHAEFKIGDSTLMIADEDIECKATSPAHLGGTSIGILLYVEDADTMFAQAVAAGANVERAVQDQFYGDRSGTLADPFGHRWTIATHKEDVSLEEVNRRFESMGK